MSNEARGLAPQSVRRAFRTSRVNVPNMTESIWQPLYDYQPLLAAGAVQQSFFQVPIGQGGKTLNDTNMELAGQIPAGQAFQITGIQVELYPGVDVDSATRTQFANDVYNFYKSGNLILRIGSKDFIRQGNLMKFAPVNRLSVDSATGLAAQAISYASAVGREFVTEGLLLESSQNFSVQLNNLAALPSAQNARLGVTLNGFLFRNAQ
jgi:hypothetical protein